MNTDLDGSLARLSAASPTAQFELGDLDRHNPDLRPFPAQLQWLTIGACMSLFVGALALTATTAAEAHERSQRLRGLHLLGARSIHLVQAHFWSAGAPLLLLGWTATAIGWIVTQTLHAFDDRSYVSPTTFTLTAITVLAAGLLIPTVTLRNVLAPG